MAADMRRRAWTIVLLAALLMVLRVDFWWWDVPMPPILFGAINLPMLYQFGIWVAGWALVIYTVNTPLSEGE